MIKVVAFYFHSTYIMSSNYSRLKFSIGIQETNLPVKSLKHKIEIFKISDPRKKFCSRNKYTCMYKLCTLLSTYNCSVYVLFCNAMKKVVIPPRSYTYTHATHAPKIQNSIRWCNSSSN